MTQDLAVLIAGAVLLVSTDTLVVVLAYVVLALNAGWVIVPAASASPVALAILLLTVAMKVVIAPLGVMLFVRENPAALSLHSSLSLPLRLLIAIGFASIAAATEGIPSLAQIPLEREIVYIVLCAIGMLIVHRNLLAHLIGLLVLGTGITLCGAVLVPQLPESVELGATFDALVGTFVGLGLIRAFVRRDPMLDVDSLRNLRG